MTRIGIFGGSFSPPHLGHVAAAERFLAECALDRLLIIPTAIPPHKASDGMPSGDHRLSLCRLAFSHLDRTEISDIEVRREGKSYTYLTLRELSAPDRELFFLCGSDMLLSLGTWKNAPELFSLARFVAVSRKDDARLHEEMLRQSEILRAEFGAQITLMESNAVDLSSTEIREAIARGEDTSRALSPKVAAYIKKWNLYL